MSTPTVINGGVSHAGSTPPDFPLHNTFDWVFSNPFENQSTFTPLAHRVPRIEGSRPIFVDQKAGRAVTFSQLQNDARALCTGLRSLGLDPNDVQFLPPTPTCPRPEVAPVVLIQLPNSLVFPTALLGVLAAGLTATLVSPALTSEEIAWILQNARPRVIITAQACLGAMQEAIAKQEDTTFFSRVPVYVADLANDTYPAPAERAPKLSPGTSDWRTLLQTPQDHALSLHIDPSRWSARTAVLLWSSGTSGRSKGVLLSHQALNFSTASLWHEADYYQGQRQRWLGYVPFYHVFGLCNIVLLAICNGATIYTMSAFNLETVLATIPREKITYFHMAPPVAVMLAKAAVVEKYAKRDSNGRNAFSTVVAGVTGGAPLAHDIVVQVHRRLGFRVRLGYGLSETCSTTMQTGITEEEMHSQVGDSGQPHWGVQLMIASGDVESGQVPKPAAIGTSGEILIKAPCLLTAYLPFGLRPGSTPDMSVTQDALTVDGWFRTGDVGWLSEDGRLRITDRIKELIKVRGFQVAPAELEAILCGSDSVADAGVVGIYNESLATEFPRAFVVARDTSKSEKELIDLAHELRALVEKNTTRYKWLQGGIVFIEAVPKSPSGKILRRELKNGAVKGYEVQVYERKKRDAKL